jgi:hypothetical protein
MMNLERRNNFWLRRASKCFCLSAFCFLLSAFCASAQSSNRWLLVVDTSMSMRDRVKGIGEVVGDLLATGMHGQMRRGDTFGIWTFNDKLHAGDAPLQIWTPESRQLIAQRTLQFLSNQRFEKSTDLADTLTETLRIVKESDVITVILISDADDLIKGTPFDTQINAIYKKDYRQQKKMRLPFVTVFHGEKGQLTAYTVNTSSWPVEIPPVPPPVIVKFEAKPKPAEITPPPVGRSLVFVGKKPEPVEVPSQPPPPVSVVEKAPSLVETPKPVVENPAPMPMVSVVPEEKPKTETQPLATETAPPAVVAKVEAPPPPEPPPVKPIPTVEPAPVSSAERKPAANPAVTETLVSATNAPPENSKPVAATTAHPSVQTVAIVPQEDLFSAGNIAIVSVAFAAVVCGFIFLSARRSRASAQASLITQSLDHKK